MKLPPFFGGLWAALRLWHFMTATLAAPQVSGLRSTHLAGQ